MRADIGDWFNFPAFIDEVKAFVVRQNITERQLAEMIDVDQRTVTNVLYGEAELTLRLACALAEGCDLSMDTYRLTQSQHERYIDDKISRQLRKPQLAPRPNQQGRQ